MFLPKLKCASCSLFFTRFSRRKTHCAAVLLHTRWKCETESLSLSLLPAVNSLSCHFCLSRLSPIWSGGIPGTHYDIFNWGMRMFLIGIIKKLTLLQNYLQFLPRKDCKIQIEFPPFYRLKSVSKLLTEAIRRCHLELLPIWIFRYFPEKAQSSGPTPPPWLILRNSISSHTPPTPRCVGGKYVRRGNKI